MSTTVPVDASGNSESAHHLRIGPRRLLGYAGYRRLLLSRFLSQWGDGLFQGGLLGAVVFNPERAVSPAEIAVSVLGEIVLSLRKKPLRAETPAPAGADA